MITQNELLIIESVLKEYLVLQDQIKPIIQRIDEIRSWCKEQGSFSTPNYVCAVTPQTRTCMAGLDKTVEALGREILEEHGLIYISTFLVVRIAESHSIGGK